MNPATHSRAIARSALPIVLAAAAIGAPIATANTGQPQQSGGCHMLSSPSTTGGNEMMANASGTGAKNMVAMLTKFSCGA